MIFLDSSAHRLLIAAWLAACSAVAPRVVDAHETIEVPGYQKTFFLEVTQDTETGTEVSEAVKIDDGIAEIFSGAGIEWDPTASLEPLISLLSEDEVLAVGTRESGAPVYVEHTYPRLTQDEPGRLTVGVSKPDRIRPGIYVGELTSLLSNPEVMRQCRVKWKVIVAVHGRWLSEPEFVHAAEGNPLRVGKPASLRFRIHTVGCDLGTGNLKLDFHDPQRDQSERALYLKLPVTEAIEPLTRFSPEGSQGCHPQWRDSAILGHVHRREATERVPQVDHQLHEIEITAPPCFLPGAMQALVIWEQAPQAANDAPLSRSSGQEPVLSGILVSPQVGFVNEVVRVLVRSTHDLGSSVELAVSGPRRRSFDPITVTRRETAQVGGVQPHFEYTGSFRPPELGSYRLGWLPEDTALQTHLQEAATFDVWFQGQSNLQEAIEVFASATPWWWFLNPNPNKGGGYETRREQAVAFAYSGKHLLDAELESRGLFEQRGNGQLVPHDPENEPLIEMQSSAPDDKEEDKEKLAWDIPHDHPLALDLLVSVYPTKPPHHVRHQTGKRRYLWRGIIVAEDTSHNRVARTVQIPLTVVVSTDRQYYLTWGVLGAIGVMLIGTIVFFYRRSAGKPSGPSPQPTEDIEGKFRAESGDEAYFGRPSSGAGGSPQEAQPSQSSVEGDEDSQTAGSADESAEIDAPAADSKTPGRQEDEGDDLDDYFAR